MKILIVSQYFWPETFRINEVAASLREAGCDVTVLTGQPNYPDGVVFPGYRWWRVSRETHEGIPILRVPLVPRGRASAVKLVLNYLSFMIGGSLIGPWLLRGRRFDVVFVYGVSPILKILPAMVVRRFTGGELVTLVEGADGGAGTRELAVGGDRLRVIPAFGGDHGEIDRCPDRLGNFVESGKGEQAVDQVTHPGRFLFDPRHRPVGLGAFRDRAHPVELGVTPDRGEGSP